ncbi:MAG: hypothetical protein RL722_1093 [Pseudomonadota bacterium]|jgi:ribosomal-protein-alanine N-acetyltransferase
MPSLPRVHLRPPHPADQEAFIAAARASRALHGPWVQAPDTALAFRHYLDRLADPAARGWLVLVPAPERGAGADARALLPLHRPADGGVAASAAATRSASGALGLPVGVFNLSQIVLGNFRSAYLGYYAFSQGAGRGLMRAGLAALLRQAFSRELGLHRLEANIQPDNLRSVALVQAAGFQREGYSPRYLKIRGRWRDHERWAIVADAR